MHHFKPSEMMHFKPHAQLCLGEEVNTRDGAVFWSSGKHGEFIFILWLVASLY